MSVGQYSRSRARPSHDANRLKAFRSDKQSMPAKEVDEAESVDVGKEETTNTFKNESTGEVLRQYYTLFDEAAAADEKKGEPRAGKTARSRQGRRDAAGGRDDERSYSPDDRDDRGRSSAAGGRSARRRSTSAPQRSSNPRFGCPDLGPYDDLAPDAPLPYDSQASAAHFHYDATPKHLLAPNAQLARFANEHMPCKPSTYVANTWCLHDGMINRLVWCPQADLSHLLLSASMDRTVRIVDAVRMKPRLTFTGHQAGVRDAAWNVVDVTKAYTCSYDGSCCVLDINTGVVAQRFHDRHYLTALASHPVNPYLVVVGSTNALHCWDARVSIAERPCRTFRFHDQIGQVLDVLFGADGNQFFSSNDLLFRDTPDRHLIAWDFRTARPVQSHIYYEPYICPRLRLHPDGRRVLAQSHADCVVAFESQAPYRMDITKRFEGGHRLNAYALGFDVSSDGRLIVSGSCDGTVAYYDYRSPASGKRALIRSLPVLSNDIAMDVHCHPHLFSMLAVGSATGKLAILQ